MLCCATRQWEYLARCRNGMQLARHECCVGRIHAHKQSKNPRYAAQPPAAIPWQVTHPSPFSPRNSWETCTHTCFCFASTSRDFHSCNSLLLRQVYSFFGLACLFVYKIGAMWSNCYCRGAFCMVVVSSRKRCFWSVPSVASTESLVCTSRDYRMIF